MSNPSFAAQAGAITEAVAIISRLGEMVRNVIDAGWRSERTRRQGVAREYWSRATGGEEFPDRIGPEFMGLFREFGCAFDRVAQRSYGLGMASRISERMQAMPPARGVPQGVSDKIMADKTIVEPGKSRAKHDPSAIGSGLAAGRDVPISYGVGGGKGRADPVQIEAKPPTVNQGGDTT